MSLLKIFLNKFAKNDRIGEKSNPMQSYTDAVSYAYINREFGEGFLFSPEPMQVGEREIDFYTSGTRRNIRRKYRDTNITIYNNLIYQKIVCLSLSIPTFDSEDREYDSWHNLYLVQEKNGNIHAAYCTGGYRIATIQGYAKVYQLPNELKRYFSNP